MFTKVSIFWGVILLKRPAMKKMEWRYVTREDVDVILVKWWNEWGFPVPPKECLPPTGIIVSDGGDDLYGGFLYLTDGGIGWMEWVVSNKTIEPSRKRGALGFFVGVMDGLAKERGMNFMFTSTVLPGFRNGLLKCGYTDGDRGIYQLIKGL